MLQQRAPSHAASVNRGSICSISGRTVPCPQSMQGPCLHRRPLGTHCLAAHTTAAETRRSHHSPHIEGPEAHQHVHGCMIRPSSFWSRLNWELLLLVSSAPVPAALADEGLKYNAERGEGLVKTLSGVAYVGLLLYFLIRVLNRRARKAREERLAGQGPVQTVFTQLVSNWDIRGSQGVANRRNTQPQPQ